MQALKPSSKPYPQQIREIFYRSWANHFYGWLTIDELVTITGIEKKYVVAIVLRGVKEKLYLRKASVGCRAYYKLNAL